MICVSISTTVDRLFNIDKRQFPIKENVFYSISIQGDLKDTKSRCEEFLVSIFGVNSSFSFTEQKGLSKNRNNALKLALLNSDCEYVYICDDDVCVDVDGLLAIVSVMRNSKLSFASGKVNSNYGNFKKYKAYRYRINKINAAKISSIELVFSMEFIAKTNLLFDERFGLGTDLPSGEEYIICTDAINIGGIAEYIPITLCSHPPLSSGKDFYSDTAKIMAKGAMIKRIFGRMLGLILVVAFAVKKYPNYRRCISFVKFTRTMFVGMGKV